jgi:hypothetical protein
VGDTTSVLVVAGGAAGAALLVLVVLLAVTLSRLAATRRQLRALEDRLGSLADRLDLLEAPAADAEPEESYLVPEALPLRIVEDGADLRPAVPDRLVLSATLGEPLVKAAAFGHGLRRALSARSRNRIWFEVRREVRRSRKQRRQDMKAAYRRMQAEGVQEL